MNFAGDVTRASISIGAVRHRMRTLACVSDAARRDSGVEGDEVGSRLPLSADQRLAGIIVVERYRRLWSTHAAVMLWCLSLITEV